MPMTVSYQTAYREVRLGQQKEMFIISYGKICSNTGNPNVEVIKLLTCSTRINSTPETVV